MNEFDCEKCEPVIRDWKKFFRELFCAHHYIFIKNAYLLRKCHRCDKEYVAKS